jgi:hypothetical protein
MPSHIFFISLSVTECKLYTSATITACPDLQVLSMIEDLTAILPKLDTGLVLVKCIAKKKPEMDDLLSLAAALCEAAQHNTSVSNDIILSGANRIIDLAVEKLLEIVTWAGDPSTYEIIKLFKDTVDLQHTGVKNASGMLVLRVCEDCIVGFGILLTLISPMFNVNT